jgi:hypothetical protein
MGSARSFAAAQDDSIEEFFRSLLRFLCQEDAGGDTRATSLSGGEEEKMDEGKAGAFPHTEAADPGWRETVSIYRWTALRQALPLQPRLWPRHPTAKSLRSLLRRRLGLWRLDAAVVIVLGVISRRRRAAAVQGASALASLRTGWLATACVILMDHHAGWFKKGGAGQCRKGTGGSR